MKHSIFLALSLCLSSLHSPAQKIDSIFVHLYTDSLKKGTFNYINIDGLLANGRYIPLDSTQLVFSSSAGQFSGNSLWIDNSFGEEKVTVKVSLKKNTAVFRQFDIYIKTAGDTEKLKTVEELSKEWEQKAIENRATKKKRKQ